MIDYCPYCGIEFKDCNCTERKRRSNMIDSSIFLGAYDEGKFSEECDVILNGAKENIYIGHVSTIILGEIMKKLLKFKKEANYRYNDILEDLFNKLLSFKLLYICEETIKNHSDLNIRGDEKSQDKLNLSCAIQNKCNLFIMKDSGFTYNKKGCLTSIAQITDRKNKKLKKLLNEIKLR
ncbi:PIN domain-containing protein [Candidatus Pacearchaeota archaeon]|jgi:predicted nucleic acid-binding protein|nr:PIN domain-containing protein [Candidatus Pacearchaeota archaeon]